MDIGKIHVLLVHFPIALVWSGLLAEILYLVLRKELFRHAGCYCVVLAGLSCICVTISGLASAGSQAFGDEYAQILSVHKWLGISALAIGLLTAAAAVVHVLKSKKVSAVVYRALLVIFVVVTALAGHYGGMLVHGKEYLPTLF